MNGDGGYMSRISGPVARWAARVGVRRRAARQAWAASTPEERSWNTLAASSAMSGWLGHNPGQPEPRTHEEQDRRAPVEIPSSARERTAPAPAARRARPTLAPPRGCEAASMSTISGAIGLR